MRKLGPNKLPCHDGNEQGYLLRLSYILIRTVTIKLNVYVKII